MKAEEKNKITVEFVLYTINDPKFWDNGFPYVSLDELLQETDWADIEPKTIIPKYQLRDFCKNIYNKEVRLAVMKFLREYANYYFYDSAYEMVSTEYAIQKWSYEEGELENRAQQDIIDFQSELETQISQIEKTGLFSGDRFSKQEEKIKNLQKENKDLKDENRSLKAKVDHFEHPDKYGKFIPSELNNRTFQMIMEYLQTKQIVLPIYINSPYERTICCYRWYGAKGLFGYYVEKLNVEFELNEAREQRNWQIFESVFENYDDIVDEARKAVSKYRKNDKNMLPAKADIVDEAIKNANGNCE